MIDDEIPELAEDVSQYVKTWVFKQADVEKALKGEPVAFKEDENMAKDPLPNYFVPQVQYDKTHRNVEDRLNTLRNDVDRHTSILEQHGRRINENEGLTRDNASELKIARGERIAMLGLLQATNKTVSDTATKVHKIEHLQMLGWGLVIVGLITILLVINFKLS